MRKFLSLHRKKMPTRDPVMQSNVRRARYIRYLMTKRADIRDAEDADEISSEAFTNSINKVDILNDFNYSNNDMLSIDTGSVPCNSTRSRSRSATPTSESAAQKLNHNFPLIETANQRNAQHSNDTLESNIPLMPKKLFRHRLTAPNNADDLESEDIMYLLKALVVQNQREREDKTQKRDEDEKPTERCYKRFMELMIIIMMMYSNNKNASFPDTSKDKV